MKLVTLLLLLFAANFSGATDLSGYGIYKVVDNDKDSFEMKVETYLHNEGGEKLRIALPSYDFNPEIAYLKDETLIFYNMISLSGPKLERLVPNPKRITVVDLLPGETVQLDELRIKTQKKGEKLSVSYKVDEHTARLLEAWGGKIEFIPMPAEKP